MKAMFMNSFLRLPGVREALSAQRQAVLRRETIPREPEVIVIDGDDDDLWSANVDKVNVSRNPEKIRFPDTGPTDNLFECKDLKLAVCKGTGIGVKATATVHAGSIIGNYTGVLTTHDFAADKEQTSDYALELQLRSTRNEKVYINATTCGGMTRMMNHSCDAARHFVEMRNRANVVVMVVTKRTIEEEEEVTVDYVDPWFDCVCGAPNCRS
ncbi:hypothetical protein F442_22340 [Phytophthora nicotianae P10297]|uniref:SET domain-containing protein n=1 Tax=Phytophthora nicotianae P10297 TaxID=1317064 RepID=W2Y2D9_PHYNI|nr:hypothetical protein F442_22340 [Phytophthora nicotianae P10297]